MISTTDKNNDATNIGGRVYNYYDYDVKGDFDDKKKIIKRFFNSDISRKLHSINMIKEYSHGELLEFMNSVEQTILRSDLKFYKINQIIIQLSKSKKTKAGSYIQTPEILQFFFVFLNFSLKIHYVRNHHFRISFLHPFLFLCNPH